MLALRSPQSVEDYFCYDAQGCRAAMLELSGQIRHLPVEHIAWATKSDTPRHCDAFWIGPKSAIKVLVLISGTHGVEGYAGSAAQRFILQSLTGASATLPDDTALVVIHALNPWGMHWARRCDQDGVDTNRNFVNFDQLPPPDPAYAELLALFGNAHRENREDALRQLSDRWGQRHYDERISGGQYTADWAPFFGGRSPGFARQCIEAITELWKLAEREQIVIDIHTGLGPWSFGELISDHPAESVANDYALNIFGPAVACTHSGHSFSVPKHGLMDYHWHDMMADRGCFLTLEFGSYGTEALFRVLLDDHNFWKTQNATPSARSHGPIRQAMLKHFCPDDRFWQQSVLWRSWQVADHALNYFSAMADGSRS